VDWFYVQNGKQVGPVPVAQFDELIRSGRIPPETLVWREGLVDWQPFSSMRATLSPLASPQAPSRSAGALQPGLPGALAGCAECGLPLPLSDMIPFESSWICAKCKPRFFQRVREGAAPAASGAEAWQSGNEVVILNGGTLPGRCIKCNGAAMGQPINSRFFWHPNRMLLLLLIPPIYFISLLMVCKQVKLYLPLCKVHRWQRRLFFGLSYLLVGIGIGTAIAAVYFDSEILELLGVLREVMAIVPAAWKGTPVWVKTTDGQYVWLRGFCKDYRASLPEFPEWR